MRRALALDTTALWGSVALAETGETGPPLVVAELGARVAGSHAPRLIGWIEAILEQAGWERDSIDLYVATRGPGSFTGVRIGLGTVRGLSASTGRPAVGVSTLEALAAAHGPAEASRIPLIDAGRGEIYGARFDAASSPPRAEEDGWVGPPQRLREIRGAAVAFGSGVESARRVLAEAPAVRIATAPRGLAAAAACIALSRHEPLGDLAPLYLRAPDVRPRTRPG